MRSKVAFNTVPAVLSVIVSHGCSLLTISIDDPVVIFAGKFVLHTIDVLVLIVLMTAVLEVATISDGLL